MLLFVAAWALLFRWLSRDPGVEVVRPETSRAAPAPERGAAVGPVAGEVPREVEPLEVDAPALEPADAPPPTGALLVRVTHAHGVPATGARVGLYRPEPLRHVAEGVLDEQGAWRHPGLDEPAALFVVGVTPQAVRFDLELARGEHALALPEGAVVTGRVLVDGAPPDVPFALSFRAAPPPGGELPAPELLEADRGLTPLGPPDDFSVEVGDGVQRGLLTDETGRFVISGLAPGGWVKFSGGKRWMFDSPMGRFPSISAPASDVVLRFVRRTATFCGRVVDPSGAPVPGARIRTHHEHAVRYWYLSDHPDWRVDESLYLHPSLEGVTDEAGRFCFSSYVGDPSTHVPVPELDADAIRDGHELRVVAIGPADLRAVARLSDPAFDEDHDLGDLVLRPTPHFALRVCDEAGAPIEGAAVRLDHATEDLALVQQTDARGTTLVETFDVGSGTLTVAAPGRETARVLLPDVPPEEPLVVRLEPATVLTVDVDWPATFEGKHLWWTVEFDGAPPIFSDALLPPATLHDVEALGGPSTLRTWLPGRIDVEQDWDGVAPPWVSYGAGRDGLVLEGLRPHHPLQPRLRLHAARGFDLPDEGLPIWTGDALWLEPGEHRTLHVDMTGLVPAR